MEKDANESPPVVVVEGEPPPSSHNEHTSLPPGAAAIKSAAVTAVNNDGKKVQEDLEKEVEVPRLKKCGDDGGGGDSSDVSPVDDYLGGDDGDIDDEDDVTNERVVITSGPSGGRGREGRERLKRRGTGTPATGTSSLSGSRSSTPKRFTRKDAGKRPRSHSRSRVLTERVLFFEQVWQGAGAEEDEVASTHKSASNVSRVSRSRSSRDLESEFSREIDALEKRLERQRQRYKSGDVFFEKITLRHTPSSGRATQSGYLSPEEYLLSESGNFSRSETHLNRQSRLSSPPPQHFTGTRSRTVSYETVENIGGDQDDVDEEDIFLKMAHKPSHSGKSKSPVYDELLAQSSGDVAGTLGERDVSSPTMSKRETKSHVIPGRVSIKYEAVDTPSSIRSRTPSEEPSEMSQSGSSSSRMSSSARQAKYEFLGVTADAISRSRTPSGGTSLSSLRSVSPRMGDSNSSLGGHHHHHVRQIQEQEFRSGQRRLIVTTTTTTEMKSVRMARSPSSGIGSIASPTSEASPRVPTQSQPHSSEAEDTEGSSVITRKSVTTTRSYQKSDTGSASATLMSPSGSESDDLYSASVASGSSGLRSVSRSGTKSPLPSAAAQEWYTQYKSKVAHATPVGATPATSGRSGNESDTPGRFETEVTKSAKSRAAYFDSHIAEIKGMCHITQNISKKKFLLLRKRKNARKCRFHNSCDIAPVGFIHFTTEIEKWANAFFCFPYLIFSHSTLFFQSRSLCR